MSSTSSQLAENNVMSINDVHTAQPNSYEIEINEQHLTSELQQQHYIQSTTDYDQYNGVGLVDLGGHLSFVAVSNSSVKTKRLKQSIRSISRNRCIYEGTPGKVGTSARISRLGRN
jgi:ubiquitin